MWQALGPDPRGTAHDNHQHRSSHARGRLLPGGGDRHPMRSSPAAGPSTPLLRRVRQAPGPASLPGMVLGWPDRRGYDHELDAKPPLTAVHHMGKTPATAATLYQGQRASGEAERHVRMASIE